MLFIDYKDGAPDPDTAQVVRIPIGTCIVIHQGKGDFVPVAEDDITIEILVVVSKMAAPRLKFSENILEIQ